MKTTLAAAIAALVVLGVAQTHDHLKHQESPKSGMDMQKCMKDMAVGEARLDALVAKMKASQGADRIDATTNVVLEMVAQEKQMHKMCMGMMGHMQ